MTTLILDADFEAQAIAHRRALGHDRYDEVWDGMYIMAPLANNEHQYVASKLAYVVQLVCGDPSAVILAGCNVSDREVDWTANYRCPDMAVYLPANPAQDLQTHWFGGPDFGVEVSSSKDRTWDKLDFYAAAQTRELLIIDRDPWKLSLLRLQDKKLEIVGVSTIDRPSPVSSEVLPISLQLEARDGQKPLIVIRHLHDGRHWNVDPVIRGR